VADVNVNPANPVIGVRSFGEDPQLTSEMVAAQVASYQRAGVAATVAYDAVLAAVHNRELGERRIDESITRILRLKWRRGIVRSPYADTAAVARTVGTPAHLAVAQRITDRTTTLLRDDANALPLKPAGRVLVTGWDDPATPTTTKALGQALNDRGRATDVLSTGAKPARQRIDAAVAEARTHSTTVVVTNRATSDTGQQQLVKALLAAGTRVIVVAVRDPYDATSFPDVPTYLATYVFNDVAMRSLAAVLTGAIQPAGRLPVTIPDPAHPGTPLFPFGAGITTTRSGD
jgi:beta-N-acetylhexosaminidase